MIPRLTYYFVTILILMTLTEIKAQQFYNNEDFFTDSAFINKHKIKIVKIRIPKLMGDSTTEFYPYQQFCFNPYGKLAWYEYDFNDNNIRRKYYQLFYYNNSAQCFKSRIFQRCDGLDSLREEMKFQYDSQGRLFHEDHYQIFIQAYNEWAYDYAWEGDSLKIRMNSNGDLDTTRFNIQGKETEYSFNNFRCFVEYNENGKRQHVKYYWRSKDQLGNDNLAEEAHYIYDADNRLNQIETNTYIINFLYNDDGLPISSWRQSKVGNTVPPLEIFYEYEFREENWAKRN